jgi:hypothetical protein
VKTFAFLKNGDAVTLGDVTLQFQVSMQQCPFRSVEGVLGQVLHKLEEFTAGVDTPYDDITLLGIQKKAKPLVMVERFLKLHRQGKAENIEEVMENLKRMLRDTRD